MIERKMRVLSIRISEADCVKLEKMQTEELPSVSAVIRSILHMAVNAPVEIKQMELKPLSIPTNPVALEVVKTPLEIPVQDDSIIESAPLIHRTGRKVSPNTLAIKMAKRAKDMGRPYDISMEQHFHILDELE